MAERKHGAPLVFPGFGKTCDNILVVPAAVSSVVEGHAPNELGVNMGVAQIMLIGSPVSVIVQDYDRRVLPEIQAAIEQDSRPQELIVRQPRGQVRPGSPFIGED